MPSIRPVSDLRNNANEISDYCRQTREPVYITRNGTGDMVVINIDEYERQLSVIDLYGKLATAEREISEGAVGEDFMTVASQIRKKLHVIPGGTVQIRRILYGCRDYSSLL